MMRRTPPTISIVVTLAVLICSMGWMVSFAHADARAPKVDAAKQRVEAGPSGMFGRIADTCTVQAVGTYNGTKDVKDVQLDRSGHRVCQAEVVVNAPGQSVVLVLSAYDPTVWRVGLTPNTRIQGVLVGGYHGQAVIGLPKRTKIEISTHERPGTFKYFCAYKASPELLEMNKSVKELVGHEIDHFEFKPNAGTFYVGDKPEAPAAVVYSDELKVTDYVEKEPAPAKGAVAQAPRLPAGQDGIDRLVKEGKLRAATVDDIDQWVEKASEQYRRFNDQLRVESEMRPGRTYVVLKPFEMPDGLFGGNLRHFLLPAGVEKPTGNPGHCSFYRIADGTAEGPVERARHRGQR